MDSLAEEYEGSLSSFFPRPTDVSMTPGVVTYVLPPHLSLEGHFSQLHLFGHEPLTTIRDKLQQMELPAPSVYNDDLESKIWGSAWGSAWDSVSIEQKTDTSAVYLILSTIRRPSLHVEARVDGEDGEVRGHDSFVLPRPQGPADQAHHR